MHGNLATKLQEVVHWEDSGSIRERCAGRVVHPPTPALRRPHGWEEPARVGRIHELPERLRALTDSETEEEPETTFVHDHAGLRPTGAPRGCGRGEPG